MMLSVRRLWQRQEQKALFLAADPAAQYFHQYFKWLFCSKGCILATQFEIILMYDPHHLPDIHDHHGDFLHLHRGSISTFWCDYLESNIQYMDIFFMLEMFESPHGQFSSPIHGFGGIVFEPEDEKDIAPSGWRLDVAR